MRIALGSDHAGFQLKEQLKHVLDRLGLSYTDFGSVSEDSVDYPDFAAKVARAVAAHEFDRGILACGTGVGMAIAANKIAGIRAAPVVDLETARLSREHNDANVLALGARITAPDRAVEIVRIFLETPFAGGRHQRRVDKIGEIEREHLCPPTDSGPNEELH